MIFERLKNIIQAEYNARFGERNTIDWEAELERLKAEEEQIKKQQNHRKQQQSTYSEQEILYYSYLELPVGASFEQIKAQYKKLMKKYHPDRYATQPHLQEQALIKSRSINEAYQYFEKKYATAQ